MYIPHFIRDKLIGHCVDDVVTYFHFKRECREERNKINECVSHDMRLLQSYGYTLHVEADIAPYIKIDSDENISKQITYRKGGG